MSGLPSGWDWASLQELGTWTGGGTPRKAKAEYWEGEIPWVSPKDMKAIRLAGTQDTITRRAVEESAAKLFLPNSLAFVVRSGILEHTLPIALIPFEATVNQDMKVLSPSPDLDPEWLLYGLLGAAPDIRTSCSKEGTTVASIEFSQLKRYRIPVPPRHEQERIAAVVGALLDRLAQAVRPLQAARELATLQTQATCSEALSGPWPVVELRELLREPLRNGHSAKASGDGAGVRTLTLTAVTTGEFVEPHTKLTSADPSDVADLWIEPGDIFIERANTPELVGSAALYTSAANWAIFPDLLIRVRVSDRLMPEFLELVLRERGTRRYFRQSAQGIAGTMPKISQRTVSSLPVPLPTISEQAEIVSNVQRHLSAIEQSIGDVRSAEQLSSRLRQAVLATALTGELKSERVGSR